MNESNTKEDWDFETSFFVEEVDVVDVQGKNLVQEYAISTICEYSVDRIVDSRCSNHVIGEEVKVYKDLKVTGTPVMEGQEIETVNVMSAKEVYEDKIVLPNTQELQENMQIKLQASPLEDVVDETEYGKLNSPIDEKLRESEIRSKLRSLWGTRISETPAKV
ncbi:hypothetical protein LIER_33888 [Lithospermum erythrorhizon]|uniref:DUF2382 domain-containing protein n=1 Tax=Lithospermum erythrorhizon TaxID=34254 RepID=A0AAV3S141_LITER